MNSSLCHLQGTIQRLKHVQHITIHVYMMQMMTTTQW